jgi:arabinofuranan 3-O-arabinosyltransferase
MSDLNELQPEVSVIIPTRDSAADLDRCLTSLADGQGASREVIVVDQESTDATTAIATAAGAELIAVPRPALYTPPTASRNAGAAVARGEYLLHLDVDMELVPGTLGKAVRMCRDYGFVGLVFEEIDIAESFWAECKALERRTYRGSHLLEAARFVRADVFRVAGGYDESLGSGEDWDIHTRYAQLGKIGRLPEAVHHRLGALTFRGQARKKFRYGRSAVRFLEKRDSSNFSIEMASAYVRSWRLFARHPRHALGFIALRLIETAAIAFGVGVALLGRNRRPQGR